VKSVESVALISESGLRHRRRRKNLCRLSKCGSVGRYLIRTDAATAQIVLSRCRLSLPLLLEAAPRSLERRIARTATRVSQITKQYSWLLQARVAGDSKTNRRGPAHQCPLNSHEASIFQAIEPGITVHISNALVLEVSPDFP